MVTPQLDRLARIGHEAFTLIDECNGRSSSSGRSGSSRFQQKSNESSQYQQLLVYHGPQISTVRMPVVTCSNYEIAQYYYGGTAAVREPVISSDEAAETYGDFKIVEYGRRYSFRSVN